MIIGNAESPRSLSEQVQTQSRLVDTAVLFAIAGCIAIVHLLTDNRYGFHRDELQFLSDARHLDWGFVAYPPLTSFVERIALALFGVSLVGLRLFSVFAQFAAIVIGGLIARELGGKRLAQTTAALCTAFSPISLFEGTEFQYTSFDCLWWILTAYLILRLLNSENPRWWLPIGCVVGIGLQTKYLIVFFIAGIFAGLFFTPARRYFKSVWFWAGVGLAMFIFLPNFLWLLRHDFISYRFLQFIHTRDVAEGRAASFLRDQLYICANPATIPLWVAGFAGLVLNRRYRMLAFMAAIPIFLLWIAKGRGYYTAAVYPMLIAMGAVVAGRWLASLSNGMRRTLVAAWCVVFAVTAGYTCAVIIPFASSGPLRQFALSHNPDMREEIGWDELVHTVAQIRDALPAEQRSSLGITTGNYGEYGAIDILGRAYGLPAPIGTTNSEWLRGYPVPSPTTFIVIGLRREQADSIFTGCRLASRNVNSEQIQNEESLFHPDIFVCGHPREPWPQLWREHRDFG